MKKIILMVSQKAFEHFIPLGGIFTASNFLSFLGAQLNM
jgi:hypothetical protein